MRVLKTLKKKSRVERAVLLAIVLLDVTILATFSDNDEIVGVTIGLSFMAVSGYLVVDRFIQKYAIKKLQEATLQAEVDALKSQINPHFLFNTLNNLYALAVEKSEKAPEVILKLSEMLRYTVYEGEKERVPIKGEIVYLQNYTELHKIRFHRDVDIQFDYLLEDENQEIPPLLFIVLLENAFKHGVESLTENAFIRAKLFATAENIRFVVKNNFAPDEKKEEGIGLANLQRRLELLYPQKHTLTSDIERETIYKATLEVSLQ